MTNFVRTFVCNGKTVSRIVVCNAGLILRKILDCTGGDIKASTEREPIKWVWGRAPSGVQG